MRSTWAALSVALAAAIGCVAPSFAHAGDPPVGLMGTIPIFWGEAGGFSDLLTGEDVTSHWARATLEQRFELQPLDYLDAASLARFDKLLLAQPRALSGEENVALDAWVRDGGRLLLFADPMMTGHSRYSLGDRRRPQDVILLSPILNHWGLALEFVEDQEGGQHEVEAMGFRLPVNLPGRFVPAEGGADCLVSKTAVLAKCRIGEGSAVILADAALLDIEHSSADTRAVLESLATLSFEMAGETAGH